MRAEKVLFIIIIYPFKGVCKLQDQLERELFEEQQDRNIGDDALHRAGETPEEQTLSQAPRPPIRGKINKE